MKNRLSQVELPPFQITLRSRVLFSDQADVTGRRGRRPIYIIFFFFLNGWNDRQRMGFQPKLARQTDWFQAGCHPPISFLAGAVQLAMMRPAQRYRKFVADLLAEPAGLCKTLFQSIHDNWIVARNGKRSRQMRRPMFSPMLISW